MSVINGRIDYSSNKAGYAMNYMIVEFQTITPLYANSGIVIKGDSATKYFVPKCKPDELGDKLPDYECDPPNSSIPEIKLIARGNTVFKRGYYKMRFLTENPSNPIEEKGIWTIGTYWQVRFPSLLEWMF